MMKEEVVLFPYIVRTEAATIEGKHKCIARGQFCRHTKKANRDYHRNGYHCGKRDHNGRYHLVYN